MRKNDIAFLTEPTRQSYVAIFLILFRLIKVVARQAWPFLLIFLFNPKKENGSPFFTTIFIVIAIGVAIMSIISYFKFYYYIEDDELVIEKGVLKKTKLNVPIDRIQTVNFKQGILHQIFKVVSLEIDTAGSTGHEYVINALSREQAEMVRDYVESQKQQIQVEKQGIEGSAEVQVQPNKLLLQLSPKDLLKIGVSQNHLRTAGVIMAFFWGFYGNIEDALNIDISKILNSWLGFNKEVWLVYLLMGLPVFLILSFLITLVTTILKNYDLHFWRTASGFKLVSGLLTKNENSANLPKIQLIRWTTNPLKRIFGLFHVRLSQASSVAVSKRMAINIPGAYEEQVTAVRQAYFPQEPLQEFEFHHISKLVIVRRMLYMGLLPTIVIMLWTYSMMGKAILIWLLLLPLTFFLSKRYHRNWKIFISVDGLRTSSGIFTERNVLLQWYKVQSVSIRQSIYQRRKELADLTFYTAAGAVKIPYIDLSKAQQIKDYVLYKIEIDKRGWM